MLVDKRTQRGTGRGRPVACLVMCYKDKGKTQVEFGREYYSSAYLGTPPETFPTKREAIAFIRSKGGKLSNDSNGLQCVIASRKNGRFYEIDERLETKEDPQQ